MGRSTLGNPRALTDSQVSEILDWHKKYRALFERRRAFKTKQQLATEIGVSAATIDYIIAQGPGYRPPDPLRRQRGRPPIVRDAATRAQVHAWYAEQVELNSLREQLRTLEQVAVEFGVSRSVIWRIIATGGAYKQISPEQRAQEIARRRQKIARIRAWRLNHYGFDYRR